MSITESIDTPLAVVRHQLIQHTERNPLDTDQVMNLINGSLEVLGIDAQNFSDQLLESTDPQTRTGLGAYNADLMGVIADQVHNEAASQADQWGGLSLLGALALTHNPEHNPSSDRATWLAQTAGAVARNLLQRESTLSWLNTGRKDHQRLTKALLSYPKTFSPETLAIEFSVLGFGTLDTIESEIGSEDEREQLLPQSLENVPGMEIGDVIPVELNESHKAKIKPMTWLDVPDDEAFEARTIYSYNKPVAIVVNLVKYNRDLSEIIKDVDDGGSTAGKHMWDRIGREMIRFSETRRGKHVIYQEPGVSTLYFGNAGTNLNLFRGYYNPLGRNKQGIPIVGLVAAVRGKDRELKVLQILTNGNFDGRGDPNF